MNIHRCSPCPSNEGTGSRGSAVRQMQVPPEQLSPLKSIEESEAVLKERRAVHDAMHLIPLEEKQAYLDAMEKAPHVVDVESDPAAFLQIDKYCAAAAAQRLARHWNLRKQLFQERAFRPLLDLTERGALSPDDRELLKAGFFLTLLKDAKGRSVLFIDEERLPISTSKFKGSRPRLAFYVQVKCAVENPLSQTDGMRCIKVLRSTAFDPSVFRIQQHVIDTCMHQKIFDFFFIGVPPPGGRKHYKRILLPLAQTVQVNDGYSKVMMGDNREKLLSRLLGEGFCVDQLPPVLGGTWSFDAVDAWFAATCQQQHHSVPSLINSDQTCSSAPTRKKRLQRRRDSALMATPVVAKLIHTVPRRDRRTVDHTYHDYSHVAPPEDYTGEPDDISQMSLVQKLHHILSARNSHWKKYIWWLPYGRAFKLCEPVDLEQSNLLVQYFAIERTATFILQLRSHGFKVLTTGKDRGAFYHECMLRGLPYLTAYMPAPRDARILKPDPNNEPCFYSIAQNFPLPCSCIDFS